jgi:prepilin-type N-terminal cleavage/methylation domain-containing protein
MMVVRLEKLIPRGARLGTRRGFTLLELSVAAAMLAMLMASAVQMIRLVSSHQRAAERRVVALEAVQSVADEIGNMRWDTVTIESAKQVTIPKPLQSYLPGATLNVAMNDEATPVSKRLRIELSWPGADGKPVAPVRLTTWVFPEQTPSQ